MHTVVGTYNLSQGQTVSQTISLTGAAVFSNATYTCTGTDLDSAAGSASVTVTSKTTTSFKVQTTATYAGHNLSYTCTG